MWVLPEGNSIASKAWDDDGIRGIVAYPARDDCVIVIGPRTAHILTWETFEEISRPGGICLGRQQDEESERDGTVSASYHSTSHAGLELLKVLDGSTEGRISIWDMAGPEPEIMSTVGRRGGFDNLGALARSIIAVQGCTMFFVHVNFWLRSVDLETFASTSLAKRHFFTPSEWAGPSGEVLSWLSIAKGDFVFASKHRLTVVKSGTRISGNYADLNIFGSRFLERYWGRVSLEAAEDSAYRYELGLWWLVTLIHSNIRLTFPPI